MLVATPLYAALLAIVFVALSVRVIGLRRRTRIPLGAEGADALLRATRAQGNFAEYVPFALVLTALAELNGASAFVLHSLGLALLVGRGLHAWGVSRSPEDFRFRVAGMALTFSTLIVGALLNLLTLAQGGG